MFPLGEMGSGRGGKSDLVDWPRGQWAGIKKWCIKPQVGCSALEEQKVFKPLQHEGKMSKWIFLDSLRKQQLNRLLYKLNFHERLRYCAVTRMITPCVFPAWECSLLNFPWGLGVFIMPVRVNFSILKLHLCLCIQC